MNCPFQVELIEDPEKQREFLTEYERLVRRCGDDAMHISFICYLIEQEIEKGKIPIPGQPPRVFVYKNTSAVLARLTERGIVELYLSPSDFDDRIKMFRTNERILILDGRSQLLYEKPNPFFRMLEERLDRFESGLGSVKIQPEEVRSRFAEIDRKYN